VRQPAGPRGPHLPAPERQAPLNTGTDAEAAPPPEPDRPLESRLATLFGGELRVEGRLVDASNATLFCQAVDDEGEVPCVYKPIRGERPLWDFPTGTLAAREVAAYAVSEATGWDLVLPTILRDGPFGPGMCQLWIDVEPDVAHLDLVRRGRTPPGWLEAVEAFDEDGRVVSLVHPDLDDLRRTAVLDVVINNADRKGGHLLPTQAGGLFVVDHGVTFHTDPKLRTVLWGWAGSPLRDDEVEVLERLDTELAADGPLRAALGELLEPAEVGATRTRVRRLLRFGALPRRPADWRALPWPPF
jgi:uncharacterized repeat protein (TIGR03843 family)